MEIEIPFGAFDSELMHQEINIPEGFEAEIKGDKIILKKTESEDKKVRKELIEHCRNTRCVTEEGAEKIAKWIAFLEKQGEQTLSQTDERAWLYLVSDVLTWKDGIGQYLDDPRVQELAKKLCGEYAQKLYNSPVLSNSSNTGNNKQKPADKVEPKFKVGDWVLNNVCLPLKIALIKDGMYFFSDGDSLSALFVDETYHLWTTQDAKAGDVLYSLDSNKPFIYKNRKPYEQAMSYCGINEYGQFFVVNTPDCIITIDNYVPATKEQRDLLFQKMKEEGYEWDSEKKELKKIEDEEYNGEDYGIDGIWHAMNILEKTLGKVDGYQTDDGFLSHQCAITAVKKLYKQKPTWSEEDEQILQGIWDEILANKHNAKEFEWKTYDKFLDWLKSLKDRYTWKPSEEQMKALHDLNLTGNLSYAGQGQVLIELYNDLKRLKGE